MTDKGSVYLNALFFALRNVKGGFTKCVVHLGTVRYFGGEGGGSKTKIAELMNV